MGVASFIFPCDPTWHYACTAGKETVLLASLGYFGTAVTAASVSARPWSTMRRYRTIAQENAATTILQEWQFRAAADRKIISEEIARPCIISTCLDEISGSTIGPARAYYTPLSYPSDDQEHQGRPLITDGKVVFRAQW